MALPLVACEDNGSSNNNPDSGTQEPDTDPVQLIAPVISLNQSTGVISWNAVDNANYYEVYENGKVAVRNTSTTYTITKTAVGTYNYTVKALSISEAYTESEFSNTVTYVVDPQVLPAEPLSAPVITLKDNQINWSAVEHATAYEIYENGEKLTQVATASYTITNTVAGEWVYAVKAISSDTKHYSPSALSNTVTYSVAAEEVGFTVTITAPTSFSSTVYVALYKDGKLTGGTKSVTLSGGKGIVTFESDNSGNYSATIVNLPSGYAATTVRFSPSNKEAEIKIISLNSSSVFKIGSNTVAVSEQQTGADKIFYFLPQKEGFYTLDASNEGKDMYISVDRTLYIDTASDMDIASFRATAGELMEITVVGFESGTFIFKILEGEVKQDLRIGIGWGNKANYIFGDCTRNLEISSPDYYVFEFGFAGLANRLITLTIDGKDYVFGEYNEDTDEVTNWLVIPLDKGSHEVTITTTGFNPGDEFGFCVLCIYQGKELRSVN